MMSSSTIFDHASTEYRSELSPRVACIECSRCVHSLEEALLRQNTNGEGPKMAPDDDDTMDDSFSEATEAGDSDPMTPTTDCCCGQETLPQLPIAECRTCSSALRKPYLASLLRGLGGAFAPTDGTNSLASNSSGAQSCSGAVEDSSEWQYANSGGGGEAASMDDITSSVGNCGPPAMQAWFHGSSNQEPWNGLRFEYEDANTSFSKDHEGQMEDAAEY